MRGAAAHPPLTMQMSSFTRQCLPFWSLVPPADQQKLAAAALAYTTDTPLGLSQQERGLLTGFVLGDLTLEQVVAQLPQA